MDFILYETIRGHTVVWLELLWYGLDGFKNWGYEDKHIRLRTKTNGKRKGRRNMTEVQKLSSIKNKKYWGEHKTNQLQYSQTDVNYPPEAITK